MNIFKLINSILFSKSKPDPLDSEGQSSFSSFMLNRWISFYDKSQSVVINETFNKFGSLFEDKDEMYKLYCNLMPKRRFKKINYIKKQAKKEDEVSLEFAKNHQLSKRELMIYVALNKSLTK